MGDTNLGDSKGCGVRIRTGDSRWGSHLGERDPVWESHPQPPPCHAPGPSWPNSQLPSVCLSPRSFFSGMSLLCLPMQQTGIARGPGPPKCLLFGRDVGEV
jgi:hypothetical protein